MPHLLEVHRDNFTISTDPTRLDADAIAEMLKRAYWAQGRPRERVDRSLANLRIRAGNRRACSL